MKTFCIFIILLFLSFCIFADMKVPGDSLVLVDEILYLGNIQDIYLRGDTAFVAFTNTMAIVDISDINNPNVLGVYTSPNIYMINAVYIAGNYAYLACDYEGFFIADISDPTNPVDAGSYIASGYAMDVVVNGNYAYLAFGNGGLHILDVSNPASIVLVGSYNNGTTDWVYSVYISGNYAYLGYTDNLYIVDISDPTNPIERSSAYCGSYAWITSIMVQDTIAYSTNMRSGVYSGGGSSYNIANPDSIYLFNTFSTLGFSRDMIIIDTFALIADSGLVVYNVTDPANLLLVDTLQSSTAYYSVDIYGIYALIGDNLKGLKFFDITDINNIILDTFTFLNGITYDFATYNDYVYLACGSGGVRIIDISDTLNMNEVGYIDLPNVWSVFIADTFLYIIDKGAGLYIYGLTDSLNPNYLGYKSISLGVDVEVKDSFAYIATAFSGVYIENIADPSNITSIIQLNSGWTNSLCVDSNYLYVAASYGGLIIYDITDPTIPDSLSNIGFTDQVFGISVYDTFAYVAAGSAGVRQLNIADKTNPIEIDYYDTPGTTFYAFYSPEDSCVYVADGSNGLLAVEFTNAKAAALLGMLRVKGGKCYQVHKFGNRLYSIESEYAFFSGKWTSISSFVGNEIYNYYRIDTFFNLIDIKYTLSNNSNIILNLYDITGRQIKELINKKNVSGLFIYNDKCSYLKNGIYFIKGNIGDIEINERLVIVK